MKNKKSKIITILICTIIIFSIISGSVIGQLGQEVIFSDDFEDGNADGWEIYRTEGDWQLTVTDDSISGDWSMYTRVNETSVNGEGSVAENRTSLDSNYSDNTKSNVSLLMKMDKREAMNGRIWMYLRDENGSFIRVSYRTSGSTTPTGWRLQTSSDFGGADVWTGNTESDGVYRWELEVNLEDDFTVLYVNGTEIHNITTTGGFSEPNNVFLIVGATGSSDGTADESQIAWWDDIEVTGPEEFNITIDANKYMEHNTKQKYTVTADDGSDITGESNVTSNNTDVITINQTKNKLISTNNTSKNEIVMITAEYEGQQDTINITVANATMENIGILPNTKWLTTFAGVNDAGLEYGLGAEIQWIFFIILMMVTGTHIARSKWIGIGIGEMLLIYFWIGEFIGLGIFLGSMIFGLFMILTQMNRSNPQINVTQRLERKAESELQKSIERDKEGPF